MPLRPGPKVSPVSLALCVGLGGCATSASPPAGSAQGARIIEGTVASIDTRPWTYDGSAQVELDVAGGGRVVVRLPARWNLCKAPPVDMQALAVGMRVQAVGEAEEDGGITVCAAPGHRLGPR